MRHARHTHEAGLVGSWSTLTIWSSAVGGAVLAFVGGGSVLTYSGAALATGAALAGGAMIHLRQAACRAQSDLLSRARAKEKDEFAAELERRDLKITRLDDELTAVRERGVVLKRQLGELRERLNDEKLHRTAATEERDRALAWAGNELNRASDALQATRDELERAMLRAAEAEYELAELRAADERSVLPTRADFAAASAALVAVWTARPAPEQVAVLDLVVTEPAEEPYLVPEAVAIAGQAPVAGVRRYGDDDTEQTAAIDLSAIDLTAYDETTEFSVRQLRDEEKTVRTA